MCWFTALTEYISELGFLCSPRQPYVYQKQFTPTIVVMLLIYIDDILISSSSPKAVDETIDLFEKRFILKRLGFPKVFLGIQIDKITENLILLHQENQVNDLLEQYESDSNFHPIVPMREIKDHIIKPDEEYPIHVKVNSHSKYDFSKLQRLRNQKLNG